MIEQRGTPRELAEQLAGLPEGRYRVVVQRLKDRDEALAEFDRATEMVRRAPAAEGTSLSIEELAKKADQMVEEVRRASISAK
ncbi:MAG: hypothetical protein IT565_02840 [Rhodospirillales bacterium]|nr:hypothetical protein [Rhodospirillales bacterium]